MGTYNNLRFFDHDSNQLNVVYSEDLGYFQGNIHLPVVSTGLYETATIYVLEEARGSLGEPVFITPISELAGTTPDKIKFKFKESHETSEDIYLYSSELEGGLPYIKIDDKQESYLLNNTHQTGTNSDGFKTVKSASNTSPLICRIALSSEIEDLHTKTLEISIGDTKIGEITIYGEIEAEDERLSVLLTNMGMNLEVLDYFIFKDSDIKEGGIDYILLNQKRKELLLQAEQIKPFIGTYKAILNAIDFFGYSNITLKEYWLNINEQSENLGKLNAVAVPNQSVIGFLADKNKRIELPNSNQKKTSRFSLVYRLNTPNGEVDEWDIPRVDESFDFAPDEVLIKLYGLKRKLQKEFLPLQAKIIDITGEGDYFSQFNQNVWNNQHSIKNQTAGLEFDSVKTPADRTLFIEDLRNVDYRLTGFGQDFNNIDNSLRIELTNSIKSFYNEYYNLTLDTFNTLTGIPIGAPIVLEVDGLHDEWDSANFSWMDAEDTGNHLLTWTNWWNRSVYEIEWVVRGNDYNETFRGPVADYKVFPLVIPRTGSYTIEANLYDLYNVKSTKIKKEWVEVKSKNVEVYGLTQLATPELTWGEYKHKWSEVGSDWGWSRENMQPVRDVIGTFYLSMDRANYTRDRDESGFEFSTVRRFLDKSNPDGFSETPGPYQWKNLKTQNWNDGKEIAWYMTRVGSDINSSFKINLIGFNGGFDFIIKQKLSNDEISDSYLIDNTYPTDENDITAWNLIADELNNLNPVDHPILTKFNYNPVLIDTNNTGTEDECFHILAVGKEPSRSYDYSDANFDDITSGEITNKIHFESYNPSFEDTYVIRDLAELHMLNHVTLAYDNTNMPGISSQKWKLINNTLKREDIYYNNKYMTYLFKDRGYYTVELELTDLNGNKNSTKKNILNII